MCVPRRLLSSMPNRKCSHLTLPVHARVASRSDWYDDEMHQSVRRVGVDLTKGVHTYTTRWREVGMDFLIDGVLVHKVRGTAGVNVPWEPMSIKAILRPKNLPSYYLGDAQLDISRTADGAASGSAAASL